ncbi:hypothetical protein HK097_007898 [Rhizophlyctis rosea]|uniref:Uncharacterized protein n=1 Tax=Rhizophlyctis rosea TaxID=64517 RepID=A0AAD5X5N2_9FUNG|nr:hypothetical protein HK097_007898 [Rhizophlyctis rosea]
MTTYNYYEHPKAYIPLSAKARRIAARGTQLVSLAGVNPLSQNLYYVKLEEISIPTNGLSVVYLRDQCFYCGALTAIEWVQILDPDSLGRGNANVWFTNEETRKRALSTAGKNLAAKKIKLTECVLEAEEDMDGLPEVLAMQRHGRGVRVPRVRVGPLPLGEGFTPPSQFTNHTVRNGWEEYEFDSEETALAYFTLDVTWNESVKSLLTATEVQSTPIDVFEKTVTPAIKVNVETKRAASPLPSSDLQDPKKRKQNAHNSPHDNSSSPSSSPNASHQDHQPTFPSRPPQSAAANLASSPQQPNSPSRKFTPPSSTSPSSASKPTSPPASSPSKSQQPSNIPPTTSQNAASAPDSSKLLSPGFASNGTKDCDAGDGWNGAGKETKDEVVKEEGKKDDKKEGKEGEKKEETEKEEQLEDGQILE